MKLEKQIKRLKELDKLNLFEFEVGAKYDNNGNLCENAIIIKCLDYNYGLNLNNYEQCKSFIKKFYKNINKTLNSINNILKGYDIRYGYQSPKVYVHMKNVIEKHLLKEKLESQLTIKNIEKRSKI